MQSCLFSVYNIFPSGLIRPSHSGNDLSSQVNYPQLLLVIFKIIWSVRPLFWSGFLLFLSIAAFTSTIYSYCPFWLISILGLLQKPSNGLSYPRLTMLPKSLESRKSLPHFLPFTIGMSRSSLDVWRQRHIRSEDWHPEGSTLQMAAIQCMHLL